MSKQRKLFVPHAMALIIGGLVLASGAASAQTAATSGGTLATGAVFGSNSTALESCYLYNAGTTTVTISSMTIVGETGSVPSLALNSCTTGTTNPTHAFSLRPNRTCEISTADTFAQAWSCKVETTGGAPLLRGVMDLRDNTNTVLANSNLH